MIDVKYNEVKDRNIGKLIIPVVIISLGGYLFVRKKKQPYT